MFIDPPTKCIEEERCRTVRSESLLSQPGNNKLARLPCSGGLAAFDSTISFDVPERPSTLLTKVVSEKMVDHLKSQLLKVWSCSSTGQH